MPVLPTTFRYGRRAWLLVAFSLAGCGGTVAPAQSPAASDLLRWSIENCQYQEARQTLWSSIGVVSGSVSGATGVGGVVTAALGEDSKESAIVLGSVAIFTGAVSALANHLTSSYADAFKTRKCEDKYNKLNDAVLK